MGYSEQVLRRARERLEQAKQERERENEAHRREAYARYPRLEQIDRTYRAAQTREALPEGLLQRFFFHDGVVREIIAGTDYTLRIDSPYSGFHTVTFCGARLKQEQPRAGAVWLYRELYRHKSGTGYEAHILFEAPSGPAHRGIRPSDLLDVKIICEEIRFA